MKICPNCNNQLEDNAAFCDKCGAKLVVQQAYSQPQSNYAGQPYQNYNPNQQANGYQAPMQTNQPPKKKTGMIIGIVAACLIVLAIIGALAQDAFQKEGYGSGNTGNDAEYNFNIGNDSSDSSSSESTTSNSEYDDILAEAYIVHFNSFFGMDSESFVSKLDSGNIYCADYGYKNDVVLQMIETLYIPVSGMDDAAKTELENTARTEFAKFESIPCCTVEYKMSSNYLKVVVTYNDLDKEENYSALYDAGITDSNTPISMSASEEGMLADGAIKK